jgi:hypothetical protein
MWLKTILLLILLSGSLSTARDISEIVGDLKKYCPYFAFDGTLFCPTMTTPYEHPGQLKDSFVLSGLGYDRVIREVRFPVLPSRAPASTPSQTFQAVKYTDIVPYLDNIFSEKSSYQGGLYILEDNFVNEFASLFANYRIDMAVTQKLYNSYSTSISTWALIPEFLEILETLPAEYNPNNPTLVNLYRERIINLFGTDVTTSTSHGGIFFQQSVVKSCYGGDITADQIADIDATINNANPGPLAYLHYRQLGLFDVKGGNPELPINDRAQIISTFPLYPAITGFNSVPLWQVVPARYQAPVKAAIEHYTNDKQVSINSIINSIEAQKVQSYKNPQDVYVYARQTQQGGDAIIHWTACPYVKVGGGFFTPRCTVWDQTAGLNSGQSSVFVNGNYFYWHILYQTQRDGPSGVMRIYGDIRTLQSGVLSNSTLTDIPFEILNNEPSQKHANVTIQNVKDSIVTSPWQHTGCINLDFLWYGNPNNMLYFSACIDCLPIVTTSPAPYGLRDSSFECFCPNF